MEAITKELTSMASLNFWEVIDLDPGYRLIGTTWVFKTKRNHLGKIVEYKAHLCAQGFTQTAGIDYKKTYLPTGCFNYLHTLIAFAATNSLPFHQKSAFLNDSLNETVYLLVPQGLDLARDKYCLRLQKAIYVLKQDPLAWYDRLKSWLAASGFAACVLDRCIFYQNINHPLWLYVNVDDIAIFRTDESSFKTEISKELDIKDIGPADLMLGVKVMHLPNGISLDQQHFANSLLFLYGMQECRPVSMPLPPNNQYLPVTKEEALEFKKLAVNYRRAIGSINYLSMATWPDLSHAISLLSQFLENPGVTHWNGFLHVLRNAYWGNCCTRKQPSVSLSTTEAEYKALCDVTSELLWLSQCLKECCLFSTIAPILVHEDNQSCINAANGDCNVKNKRMKHVDIQLHFIKEVIRSSAIRLIYTPSYAMLADFLTKSVPRPTLSRSLPCLSVILLGASWPDFAYAVNYLARFSLSTECSHWDAMNHLLAYLCNTKNLVILISKQNQSSEMNCFVDANWGGKGNRSMHGYLIMIGMNPIAWKSKRQTTIASSTAQAEYMALSLSAREDLWLYQLLHDILNNPIPKLLLDNKTAVVISTDSMNFKQTRHLIRNFNITNEYVATGKLALQWVSTNNQLDDIMTKLLGSVKNNQSVLEVNCR
ncbi:hypothetical protein O181_034644 [Austropuccinia psidii MF-1]|uniref:Reverse transcriptase Ty1/copia-type domain-containing protein n=1 Tax=Austropuccinia psidii MF-1 TaxID=1389203 RepID=A0A9Q3D159_9BASI|nr:hypothetical protein [Austropuccinia psidii MF-1]